MPNLFSTLMSQNGMTLTEVVVAVGLLSISTLASFSILIAVQNNYQTDLKENERAQLLARIVQETKNPWGLKQALQSSPGLNCLSDPNQKCTNTSNSPFKMVSLDPNNTTSGPSYYRDDGSICTEAPSDCASNFRLYPLQVELRYNVTCPRVSQNRNRRDTSITSCPANQGLMMVDYTMSRRELDASGNLAGTSVIFQGRQRLDLGKVAAADVTTGASVEKTATESRMSAAEDAATRCPMDAFIAGFREDGSIICKTVAGACPAGHLFQGLEYSAGTMTFRPICMELTCPAGQVLVGIDTTTNRARCAPVNSANISCNFNGSAGTSPAGTGGTFMVGVDENYTPICESRACAPGHILARFDDAPSSAGLSASRSSTPGIGKTAVCFDMRIGRTFFPRCSVDGSGGGGTCHQPPTNTPPSSFDFFYTNEVSVPYYGVPYITSWSGGHPRQVRRSTVVNYASRISPTNERNGSTTIYEEAMGGNNLSSTRSGSSPRLVCRERTTGSASGVLNGRCQHYYQEVTRRADSSNCTNGWSYNVGANNCRVDVNDGFYGGNTCTLSGQLCSQGGCADWYDPPAYCTGPLVAGRCQAPNYMYDPPAYCTDYNYNSYGYSSQSPSEQSSQRSETGNLRFSISGDQIRVSCEAPSPHYSTRLRNGGAFSYYALDVGGRADSTYSYQDLVVSCNWEYNY